MSKSTECEGLSLKVIHILLGYTVFDKLDFTFFDYVKHVVDG